MRGLPTEFVDNKGGPTEPRDRGPPESERSLPANAGVLSAREVSRTLRQVLPSVGSE